MKPDWPTLDVSRLGDDFESWRNGLAYPVQKALTVLRAMHTNQHSIADNMNAAIVTFGTPIGPKSSTGIGVQHGVEFPFKSAFRPIGFTPLSTWALDGVTAALPVVGEPVINYNRADKKDGWYGITFSFERNHTYPYLQKTIAQSLGSGVGPAALTTTWGSAVSQGSVITESGGTWSVSEAGNYLISAFLNFENGGAGYTREYFDFSGISNAPQFDWQGASSTIDTTLSFVAPLTAGQTFQARLLQVNGGAAARAPQVIMSVQRLYNSNSYSALVTGILWGG